jgi:hypothetical protein
MMIGKLSGPILMPLVHVIARRRAKPSDAAIRGEKTRLPRRSAPRNDMVDQLPLCSEGPISSSIFIEQTYLQIIPTASLSPFRYITFMRLRSHRRQKRINAHSIRLETKWGWQPSVEQGWSVVPSALLKYAADLGLSPSEGWFLIQLLDLKWSAREVTASLLSERCRLRQEETLELLQSLSERRFIRFHSKMMPMRSSSKRKSRPRASHGWEIDLSPLIRMLNHSVMRDGDLSVGFLRISEAGVKAKEADDDESDLSP